MKNPLQIIVGDFLLSYICETKVKIMEIKSKEEADKIGWKIFELRNELRDLEEPLKKFYKEESLRENKEKYEGRIYHNNVIGTGIMYVQEVTKYEARCVFLNGSFAQMETPLNHAYGHHLYEAKLAINVSVPLEKLREASEWIGIGVTEYKRLVERVEMVRELFENNKSQ